MDPVNLKEKHSLFTKQWHPHQIAKVDDMQVLLAKVQGEFVWHAHENEDELFQVLNPSTKNGEEVHLLLFEKQNTAHTGKVEHELTQNHYPKI